MERYDVRVTDHAKEQLLQIANYITDTLQAPDAARQWLMRMKEAMARLDVMPQRHPLLAREPWHSLGVRAITVMNYRVFYRIDEAKREVWFIAVLYQKQDQYNALLETFKDE